MTDSDKLSPDLLPDIELADHPVPRKKMTPLARLSRIFFRFMLFVFVVFCIAALGIGWWFRKYCPPISLEKANSDTLIGWLVLRDEMSLEPATQQELLKKYLEHFGPDATTEARGFRGVNSIVRKYMLARLERIAQWNQNREHIPCLRNEYHIVLDKKKTGKYIGSDEIFPAPDLTRLLDRRDEFKIPEPKTKTEGNCRMLTRNWFLLKMKEFDSTPDNSKIAFLEKTVQELNWWQQYYNDFLTTLDLPEMTDLELLREFDILTLSWYQTCEPNELARLLWFKDLLVSVTVLQRMKVKDYTRFLPLNRENLPGLHRLFQRETLPFPRTRFWK